MREMRSKDAAGFAVRSYSVHPLVAVALHHPPRQRRGFSSEAEFKGHSYQAGFSQWVFFTFRSGHGCCRSLSIARSILSGRFDYPCDFAVLPFYQYAYHHE